MNPSNLPARPTVGQILFVVGDEYGFPPKDPDSGYEVVVTRIGNRWCYFRPADMPKAREDRFDLTNPRWPVDAGEYSSYRRMWRNREEWIAWQQREAAMRELRRLIAFGELDPRVTLADVREAARLLGIRDELDAAMKDKV